MLSSTHPLSGPRVLEIQPLTNYGFYTPLLAISSRVKDIKWNTSRQKSLEEVIFQPGYMLIFAVFSYSHVLDRAWKGTCKNELIGQQSYLTSTAFIRAHSNFLMQIEKLNHNRVRVHLRNNWVPILLPSEAKAWEPQSAQVRSTKVVLCQSKGHTYVVNSFLIRGTRKANVAV